MKAGRRMKIIKEPVEVIMEHDTKLEKIITIIEKLIEQQKRSIPADQYIELSKQIKELKK